MNTPENSQNNEQPTHPYNRKITSTFAGEDGRKKFFEIVEFDHAFDLEQFVETIDEGISFSLTIKHDLEVCKQGKLDQVELLKSEIDECIETLNETSRTIDEYLKEKTKLMAEVEELERMERNNNG